MIALLVVVGVGRLLGEGGLEGWGYGEREEEEEEEEEG